MVRVASLTIFPLAACVLLGACVLAPPVDGEAAPGALVAGAWVLAPLVPVAAVVAGAELPPQAATTAANALAEVPPAMNCSSLRRLSPALTHSSAIRPRSIVSSDMTHSPN